MYCMIHVMQRFQQYFSYIMTTSFSGGRSRSTWREPPTMGNQLVNFIDIKECYNVAPLNNKEDTLRLICIIQSLHYMYHAVHAAENI
jgi:hypothetical protein